MQRAFSGLLASSGDPVYSAEKAGYSAPGTLGPRMAANVDVAEDVRRRARQRLQTEGAEIGVAVLIEIASDAKQKGSARVAAASRLVQHSGVAAAQGLSERDLAEMAPDQIRELLGQAQRQLAERMAAAKTIDHKPAAPIEPESVESAQAAPNCFD